MMMKILSRCETILKVICGLFCGILVAILFYAVVMRYLFHSPPAWSMELGRFLFLWMIVLSAVLVTREQSHIQITLFQDMLPPRWRIVWTTVLKILMLCFCGVMVKQGFLILPLVSEAATPTLGISMGWLYATVPIGGILIGLAIIETLVRSLIDYNKRLSIRNPSAC
jgi:TRAP-type C4-dicarboxylate transport system permease small subunit